ncbi:MAG: tetratricopeptide repeat protein [Myxococcales bacterium]|nr:tetratricopeptide repeat protein [Myxococcales bacterium]
MRSPIPRLALLGSLPRLSPFARLSSFAQLSVLALLSLLVLQLPLRAIAADETPTAVDETPRAAIDLSALRKNRAEKAGRYPIAQRISRYLAAAANEVDEGDPKEATRLLQKLRPKRLNPYERALVYRMLAHIAYGANDLEVAIEYFVLFLDEEMLPIRDEARVRYNIAQLYAQLQQWQEAIDWLNRWLRYTENPDPGGFYLMGIAYFQLEDFDAAIAQSKKAVRFRPNPKEPWIRLLAALYAQKEDYKNAAPVLEELVLRFPKKAYWVQLSLIYGAHENYRRSLSVQQVAYAQGFLTEDNELRRLARSYLYHELPYPAAQVLEKALEDGTIEPDSEAFELLANSWIAAREYQRSLDPLRSAAKLSEDGNLYVRLGQVHMQSESWSEASALLEKALEKGGLKDLGNAELLLGIAYYNGAQVARARSSFLRARKHDSTRKAASRWITHLDTEADPTAS